MTNVAAPPPGAELPGLDVVPRIGAAGADRTGQAPDGPPKGFLRGVVRIVGGTAMGQLVILLASPALTRLYPAADFGVLAVFTAMLGITTVAACLRYDLAIPLPKDTRTAFDLLLLSLLGAGATAALAGLVVAVAGGRIATATNTPALALYLWLLPVGVLVTAVYRALSFWALRLNEYARIGRTKVAQGVSVVCIQLALGVARIAPLGLLLGQVAGQAAGSASLAGSALRYARERRDHGLASGLRRTAYEYRRFPLYSTWAALLNTLSFQVPVLLVAALFGPAVTGMYSLSLLVLQGPAVLIGQSVAQVFLSGAAEAARQGRIRGDVEQVAARLIALGFLPFVIVAVAGPEIFAVLFGAHWREAGRIAQWLAPWLFLTYVGSPLSVLPSVLQKQVHEMVFQGAMLAGRVAALVVGAWMGGPEVAIALFALVSAALWVGFLGWSLALAGSSLAWAGKRMWGECRAALPLVLLLLVVRMPIVNRGDDLVVVAAVVGCSAVYLHRLSRSFRSNGWS